MNANTSLLLIFAGSLGYCIGGAWGLSLGLCIATGVLVAVSLPMP